MWRRRLWSCFGIGIANPAWAAATRCASRTPGPPPLSLPSRLATSVESSLISSTREMGEEEKEKLRWGVESGGGIGANKTAQGPREWGKETPCETNVKIEKAQAVRALTCILQSARRMGASGANCPHLYFRWRKKNDSSLKQTIPIV